MSVYDLRSLNLPKLSGKMLSTFTSACTNSITQSLLMGSLLENGGLPKFRQSQFSEAPTYLPLAYPAEHARAPQRMPQEIPASPRPERSCLPFNMVRDYVLAYRQGNLTPLQSAEHVIAAIAASECTSPPMHLYIASQSDDIQQQAEHSTELLRKGQPRSLLEGVPVAVKDEIDMLPYPTTAGTSFLGAQPAAQDSFVAARLRAAGALLTGKTNMREIGISPNGENVHYGRVANPYNLPRDSGGSSSGSGAVLAAGIVPAAIGADGGGSIRIPASLCGIVGLKPTFGRVSERGAAPLCWSVAHLGPMGASVEDVALVYEIIAGPDPAEPNSLHQPPVTLDGWNIPDLQGVSLGIYPEWFEHAHPEVVDLNRKMVAEFEKAGAKVIEVAVPELDGMRVAHVITILGEMAASLKNFAAHWSEFSPSSRLSLVIGEVTTSHDYILAQRMRTRALNIFAEIYRHVDVILTPATALTAPIISSPAPDYSWSDLGTDTEMMRYVFPANLTGLPAISFPVGYDSAGMPVGMQAMGRHWEEPLLLRLAYNAELRLTRRLPPTYFGANLV